MGMYVAYGVLTAVMAGGMLLVFILRNRMVLWKNRVYLRMLIILLLAVVAELLWRSILPVFLQPNLESEVLFRIFVTICTLFLFYQFFLYDMAVTCKMMLKKTVLFQFFFCIFLLVNAISVISPLYNLTWFYNKNLHNYNLWGNFLQLLILLFCLCAGVYLIIRSKNMLNKREYQVLLLAHYLLVIDLYVQLILNTRNRVSYFLFSVIMIIYYRLFHRSEQ